MIPDKIKAILKQHGLEHLTEDAVREMHKQMGFHYPEPPSEQAKIDADIKAWATGEREVDTSSYDDLPEDDRKVIDNILAWAKH